MGVQLGIAVGVFTSMALLVLRQVPPTPTPTPTLTLPLTPTSMALLVLRQALPNHAILGRLPGTSIFRDVRRYRDAQHIPGVV